jgi:hypothetical protein
MPRYSQEGRDRYNRVAALAESLYGQTVTGMQGEALRLIYEYETAGCRRRSFKMSAGRMETLTAMLSTLGYTFETDYAATTFAGRGYFAKVTGRRAD